MTPRICNFYVTLRCNATCEFCQIWHHPEHQEIGEAGNLSGEILAGLKKEGVKDLKITGGEPLLREDLPEILKTAKELGFQIELTTNGILYAEKSRALNKLADKIFFSLDYPIAGEHDRSRGTECFHLVMQNIKLAQSLGEKVIINFKCKKPVFGIAQGINCDQVYGARGKITKNRFYNICSMSNIIRLNLMRNINDLESRIYTQYPGFDRGNIVIRFPEIRYKSD